jgi:hypothetical protein
MKINQDIISTYILISNFMKINQDIIVTLVMTGVTGLLVYSLNTHTKTRQLLHLTRGSQEPIIAHLDQSCFQ